MWTSLSYKVQCWMWPAHHSPFTGTPAPLPSSHPISCLSHLIPTTVALLSDPQTCHTLSCPRTFALPSLAHIPFFPYLANSYKFNSWLKYVYISSWKRPSLAIHSLLYFLMIFIHPLYNHYHNFNYLWVYVFNICLSHKTSTLWRWGQLFWGYSPIIFLEGA